MVLTMTQAATWDRRSPLLALGLAAVLGAAMVPSVLVAGDMTERCDDGRCQDVAAHPVWLRVVLLGIASVAALTFPFAIALVLQTLLGHGTDRAPQAALAAWCLTAGLCGVLVGSLLLSYGGYVMTEAIDFELGFYMAFPALAVLAGLVLLVQWFRLRRIPQDRTNAGQVPVLKGAT